MAVSLSLCMCLCVYTYIYIYMWNHLLFGPLSFFYWSCMQMRRAGWEPPLRGGQCCCFAEVVMPSTQQARGGGHRWGKRLTAIAAAMEWGPQYNKMCRSLDAYASRGMSSVPVCWWRNFDDLSHKRRSQGRSALCRTNPVPQASAHQPLFKHRCATRVSRAVTFQVSFSQLSSLRNLIFHSWENAFPWVLAWSNEDIRWLVLLTAGERVLLAGSLAEVLYSQRHWARSS